MNVSIIGPGRLGKAIQAFHLKNNNINVHLINRNSSHLDIIDAFKNSELIHLCTKPKDLSDLSLKFEKIDASIKSKTPIVSWLAGTDIDTLHHHLQLERWMIYRAMSNVFIEHRQGLIYIYNQKSPLIDRISIYDRLKPNQVKFVENEKLIHYITMLLGCGPAFIAEFLKKFEIRGRELGIDEIMIKDILINNLTGLLKCLKDEKDLEELQKQIASPGGFTERGLLHMRSNINSLEHLMKNLIC